MGTKLAAVLICFYCYFIFNDSSSMCKTFLIAYNNNYHLLHVSLPTSLPHFLFSKCSPSLSLASGLDCVMTINYYYYYYYYDHFIISAVQCGTQRLKSAR